MKKISRQTAERALLYLRTLEGLLRDGESVVSSRQLAAMTGLTDVQIRKDVSGFGKVGRPRIGYRILDLKKTLEAFVLQDEVVHIVLFGAGNLGAAILRYPGFHQDRIKLVAAFDVDPLKVGRKIQGVRVYPVREAVRMIAKTHADVGIIAVTAEASQAVADVMVLAGLRGIVNFTPTSIRVPRRVSVRNIDLSIEFLSLFCGIR